MKGKWNNYHSITDVIPFPIFLNSTLPANSKDSQPHSPTNIGLAMKKNDTPVYELLFADLKGSYRSDTFGMLYPICNGELTGPIVSLQGLNIHIARAQKPFIV